jgi:uncharacterized protein YprB with RNaseH-like and TPR domain
MNNYLPKVLVFDIETYGGLKAHMSEVSCFGYQWLGENKPAKVISGLDFEGTFKRGYIDDSYVLSEASNLLNEADATIAHYGERFDKRFLNTRIEHHGMPPLKPTKLIDTWRISKENFALHSNSLDTLLKFFKAPAQKIELDYEEWRSVGWGDKKSLKKLIKHCKNDVEGLCWVFEKHLASYTKKLPNFNLFVDVDKPVCSYCGSSEIVKRGFSYNQTTVWQQYQCRGCARWPRGPIGRKGVIR